MKLKKYKLLTFGRCPVCQKHIFFDGCISLLDRDSIEGSNSGIKKLIGKEIDKVKRTILFKKFYKKYIAIGIAHHLGSNKNINISILHYEVKLYFELPKLQK